MTSVRHVWTSPAMRGSRCLVMGGAGFIGSHLCERLFAEGAARVVSVDSLITGNLENLAGLLGRSGFEELRHDVTEPFGVDGALDFVFNLASPASPVDYAQLPLETLRTGAWGTEHGLRLAEEKRAIFFQASTSEVYGDPLVHPQREDYCGNVNPVGPRAVYDEAKRYGEALVSAWHRTRGLPVRIARIFNTYGPRMRLEDGRVVPAFISQALEGRDFTVFGDGLQTRSFCFVDDLVEGILRLVCSEVSDPVNLGNPREMTILAFAEAVRAAAGRGGRILHRQLPTDDPRQRQPDIGRARSLLGWEPRTGLEEGLRRTIAWFREHGHLAVTESGGGLRKATP